MQRSCFVKSGVALWRAGSQVMWQVGSRGQRWMSDNSHVRCKVGIVVWGECMEIGNWEVSLDHCCCI